MTSEPTEDRSAEEKSEPGEGATPPFRSAITITPEGEVIFENLSEELVDVAWALNPDDPGVGARKRILDQLRRRRAERTGEGVLEGEAAGDTAQD